MFVTIDFVRWCLKMELLAVTPTFRELDGLFGLSRTYAYTQFFPLDSLVVIQDRFSPPEGTIMTESAVKEPNETLLTTHQFRYWMEGLRQKSWTLITTLMLIRVADQLGIKVDLMGQGDNQVIVLHPPAKKPWQIPPLEIAALYVTRLARMSESLGM